MSDLAVRLRERDSDLGLEAADMIESLEKTCRFLAEQVQAGLLREGELGKRVFDLCMSQSAS